MKVSLNWIKDYVDLPDDLELSRLSYDLTMATVEVEGMTELARKFDNMVVGVIKKILPHPKASKLVVCETDLGFGNVKEIVCGGTNLIEGMKVAVALPGAVVRWHGTGDLVELKITSIRDVDSYGMICASSEIGLSELFPFSTEGTVIDLSEFDATAGSSLAVALGLEDVIVEIDNKSLTNRPDLWGHYGIAREISALYNLPLKNFSPFKSPTNTRLDVVIEDSLRCPRYAGVKIEGLSVKSAPFDIQSRIWRVGLRPINAIVDITNYVMLATGNPTHAFDSDKIQGRIIVRHAQANEKLLLLDDKELILSIDDLVIADDEGSVGLAGVMGGKRDSVLPETNKVILEVANFEGIGIRRTALRYDSRTESAIRFEKGIDQERVDITLSLAMQLFADIFPNMIVTAYCDNYSVQQTRKDVSVSLSWLEKRLGKSLSLNEITPILTRLGFEVSSSGDDVVKIIIPTWRATGDVSMPDDIMEEIARMYGYENFEPAPITTSFEGAINQTKSNIDRNMREYLAFRCGMNEIFTYPWVSDEYVHAIFGSSNGMLALSAPPSPNEKHLRTSLIPNLCKAIASNLRYFDEFSIFESAQVFFNQDFGSAFDSRESLPLQSGSVAGAFVGSFDDMKLLYRKAKGVIEAIPRYLHIESLSFEKKDKPMWADNVVWLNVKHGGKQVGDLALLSKKATLACGIKNSSIIIFELNLDSLCPLPSRTNTYISLPKYPVTDYDISLLFDNSVSWSEITQVIKSEISTDGVLRDVVFVDEYKGSQIPDGKKSITIRMLIGSINKTLTSEEIERCANSVRDCLKIKLGADIRL